MIDATTSAQPPHLSRAEFDKIFARCDSSGDFGPADQRGALNFIGPQQILDAATLVTSGRTVSCGWTLDTVQGPDNPNPVRHEMTFGWEEQFGESGDLRIAGDRFEMDIHGDAHSHLDALCHVGFAGSVYNGVPLDQAIDDGGAIVQGVGVAGAGIVTRGVLLDMPRLRDVPWIPPGEALLPDEILAAEVSTGTRLRRGDIVMLRTGHSHRRRTEGPWDAANAKAGIHATVLPIFKDREIAGIGYDGDGEAVPANCEGITYPIHAISLPALGWWTMDSLALDDLANTCVELERWEFLLVIAPLRLIHGTGSPVNPIAIF
jgi:hypothetical protein